MTAEERLTYRLTSGKTVTVTAIDGHHTIHIVGVGRDENSAADEELADEIDGLAIDGLSRTWANAWDLGTRHDLAALEAVAGPPIGVQVTEKDPALVVALVDRALGFGDVHAWITWASHGGVPLQVHIEDSERRKVVEGYDYAASSRPAHPSFTAALGGLGIASPVPSDAAPILDVLLLEGEFMWGSVGWDPT